MPIFSSSSQDGLSATRSLFSRISLRPPAVRNIQQFHIELDNPHAIYTAGQHVRGKVVLAVSKTLSITHVVIALHGYVRVSTTEKNLADKEPVHRPLGDSDVQWHGKGGATLFQREKALGSEGFLKGPAQFHFPFDMEFPSISKSGLPSTCDTDKGVIRYNLIATMTLPTTRNPTRHCCQTLRVKEEIDIAKIPTPRVAEALLDPVRLRRRRTARSEAPQVPRKSLEPLSDADSARRSVVSEPIPQEGQAAREMVDGRSTFSADSNGSENPVPGVDPTTNAPTALRDFRAERLQELTDKTIRVNASLLKGGFLAGDQISVKVDVRHRKFMKSMNGIFATLYRSCIFVPDPRPSAFQIPREEERHHSDYHAGSRSRVASGALQFRKDLSQAVAPLIVDPTSNSAEATLTLRLPEDAFPTIKHVPGQLLSFIYRVEVVVDLAGKLDDKIYNGQPSHGTSRGGTHAYWNHTIIDTEQFRDDTRGLVTMTLDLVVGNSDSQRVTSGRQNSSFFTRQPNGSSVSANVVESVEQNGHMNGNSDAHLKRDDQAPRYSQSHHSNGYSPRVTANDGGVSPMDTSHQNRQVPAYIPPPSAPDLNQMSEKERIRYHEGILLPSQPPQVSNTEAGPSGTAPPEEVVAGAAPNISPASHSDHPPLPSQILQSSQSATTAEPSAPTLEIVSAPPGAATTDDKQELERQRLLAEASAPPVFPDDCASSSSRAAAGPSAPSAPPGVTNTEPSAPVLTEEDEYHMIGPSMLPSADGAEVLPRYQR